MNPLDEVDAEVERILAMSDEEVCAELRRMGLDPEEEAEKAKRIAYRAISECWDMRHGKPLGAA